MAFGYESGRNLDLARQLERESNTSFIMQIENPVSRRSYEWFIREDMIPTKTEKYRFRTSGHAVQKWTGMPDYKIRKEHEIVVKTQDWDWSTYFDDVLLRENRRVINEYVSGEVAEGARQFMLHKQKLFIETFTNPDQDTFDGLSFYNVAHKMDNGGIFSNQLTGSGVTLANITADVETAMINAMLYLDASGGPYMRADDIKMHIYHNSNLQPVFSDLFENPEVPDGAGETNKWFGKHTHEMVPELETAGNNNYYIGLSKDYEGRERPFYLIWYEEPRMVFVQDDFENRVNRKWHIVGRGSYDFNVGFPGFFVKVTNA